MFDGHLCRKGETVSDLDWYEFDPCWIESEGSHECFDILERMLETGESHPMESAEGRDGTFEKDALFLVFEQPDLLKLREMIDNAILLSQTRGTVH